MTNDNSATTVDTVVIGGGQTGMQLGEELLKAGSPKVDMTIHHPQMNPNGNRINHDWRTKHPAY